MLASTDDEGKPGARVDDTGGVDEEALTLFVPCAIHIPITLHKQLRHNHTDERLAGSEEVRANHGAILNRGKCDSEIEADRLNLLARAAKRRAYLLEAIAQDTAAAAAPAPHNVGDSVRVIVRPDPHVFVERRALLAVTWEDSKGFQNHLSEANDGRVELTKHRRAADCISFRIARALQIAHIPFDIIELCEAELTHGFAPVTLADPTDRQAISLSVKRVAMALYHWERPLKTATPC